MTKKVLSILMILFCLSVSIKAYGTDITEESYDRQLSYSVLPVNQGDNNNLYFDLKLNSGEKQVIYLRIKNEGLREEEFSINISQATTTKQGIIDYQGNKEDIHESLKYNIDDYVSYEKTVKVAPKESIDYPITVTCPKEEFDGIILAGIFVNLSSSSDNDEVEGIVTTTGYSFALMLSQNDNELESQIKFDSVYPDISFGETSIVAKLFNPVMKGYGGLSYHAVITKNNKEFIDKKYIEKEFAPNSFCDFVIDLDNKPLIAGSYLLNLSIEDKRGNKWVFEEPFTVTKQKAKQINAMAITDKSNNHIIIYGLIMLTIIICSVLYVIFKKYKKTKEN